MPSTNSQPSAVPSPSSPVNQKCSHPRVLIVARAEDSEFVECEECREVFESSDLNDMAVEDSATVDDPPPDET